jgi:hypothetical protein
MSEMDFDIDNLDDDSGSNVLKELRKAYKAKEKQVRELEEKLTEISTASRRNTIEGVLTNAGVDTRIARFIPDEVTSAEGVQEWLSENGDLFGVEVAQQQEPAAPEVEAAYRMANMANAAPSLDGGDLMSRIESATSVEELNEALFGNPIGQVK